MSFGTFGKILVDVAIAYSSSQNPDSTAALEQAAYDKAKDTIVVVASETNEKEGSITKKGGSRADGSQAPEKPTLTELRQDEVLGFPRNEVFMDATGRVWRAFRDDGFGMDYTRSSIYNDAPKIMHTMFNGNYVVSGLVKKTALGLAIEHTTTAFDYATSDVAQTLRQVNAMIGAGFFGKKNSAYLTVCLGFGSDPARSEGKLKLNAGDITAVYVMNTKTGQFVHSAKVESDENNLKSVAFTSSLTRNGMTATVLTGYGSENTLGFGGAIETELGKGWKGGFSSRLVLEKSNAERNSKSEFFLSKMFGNTEVTGSIGKHIGNNIKNSTYGKVSINVYPWRTQTPQKIIR